MMERRPRGASLFFELLNKFLKAIGTIFIVNAVWLYLSSGRGLSVAETIGVFFALIVSVYLVLLKRFYLKRVTNKAQLASATRS